MLSKENNSKKNAYFQLPPEDRMEFELEDKEKKEKEIAVEKVYDKLNKNK